ncbi:MAG: ATP-dependent RecD-like DNA helicase [Acidobacteria bacterium]|nr:ATP-dependent RecD-like DNA helicase [Acidobacteriota bacterium]
MAVVAAAAVQGRIERIVFYNEQSGYLVARLATPGRRATICVVGNVLQAVREGDELQLQGEWASHPKYGDQFKFTAYHVTLPTDADGIERYLGSGLIKGIGKGIARRIVEKFGAETLAIIENEPDRLKEVKGLTKKRIGAILEKWGEQRELREALIFFQGHGITAGQATKIFKRFGREAIAETRRNPYQLVEEIWGIGFKTADGIAMKIGFDPQSPLRAEAAVLYALEEGAAEGHVYLPLDELIERCARIVPVEEVSLAAAVESLILQRRVVKSGISLNEQSIYVAPLFYAEKGVAEIIVKLLQVPPGRLENPEAAVRGEEERLGLSFSDEQRDAIVSAVEGRLVIITGGPGTGKTTIVRALADLLEEGGDSVALAAPTGKAAKRLAAATGRTAITIHRLLEFNPVTGEFARDADNPLECHTLILDECSMIDLALMYTLLKAVPAGCRLVLVGDKDQLPSIRAGNFLADAIACGRIPTVELKRIYRQSEKSYITLNAHRIREGSYPITPDSSSGKIVSDFYFVAEENEEKILATILKLYIERIPRRLYELGLSEYDPFSESIQVISPMYRGLLGVDNLNATLQSSLNPPGPSPMHGWTKNLRMGDKVIQLRNNYKKEVFNGEMGRVSAIDEDDKKVAVGFDERRVWYEMAEIDELALAYALTVHKSQGSEFEAVIMPLLMAHYIMLDRNLLYTAVSRAKKLLIVIGSEKALRYGIHNNKPRLRYTHLMDRIVKASS